MLIWTELPNGGMATERSRGRKERLLKGIVDRDGNHPSIIIWTIINENWGVDLVHDADHREWLKQTFAWLKGYDPTRLVVDNSPLAPSFHVESDIADYHFYAAIPDHRAAWDKFVDGLADRAPWLYAPTATRWSAGDEPLMCSEFGNWGLPYPKDLAGPEGRGALVVRDRPRLGRGRHVRPRRREPFHRLEPRPRLRRSAALRQRGAMAAVPGAQISDRGDAAEAAARRLCHHRAARLPLGVERAPRHAPQSARLPRAVPHREFRHGDRAEVGSAVVLVRGHGPVRDRRRARRRRCDRGRTAVDPPWRRRKAAQPAAPRGADGARSRRDRASRAGHGRGRNAPGTCRAARRQWTAHRAQPSRHGGASGPQPGRGMAANASGRQAARSSPASGPSATTPRGGWRMRPSWCRTPTTRRSPAMCAPARGCCSCPRPRARSTRSSRIGRT